MSYDSGPYCRTEGFLWKRIISPICGVFVCVARGTSHHSAVVENVGQVACQEKEGKRQRHLPLPCESCLSIRQPLSPIQSQQMCCFKLNLQRYRCKYSNSQWLCSIGVQASLDSVIVWHCAQFSKLSIVLLLPGLFYLCTSLNARLNSNTPANKD